MSKIVSLNMKIQIICPAIKALLLGCMIFSINAEEVALSDSEKDDFLEQVKELEETINSKNSSNAKRALAALNKAMQSDTEALKLFKECYLTVQREETLSSNKATRDNQRNIADNVSKEFKRALRYELYWLHSSLCVSIDPSSRMKHAENIAKSLKEAINDSGLSYAMIFNRSSNGKASRSETSAELKAARRAMGGSTSPLYADPFNSVFAKVYEIEHLKPKDWPRNVMDYNGIFDRILIKDALEKNKYDKARSLCQSRLLLEQKTHKEYGLKSDTGNVNLTLENFNTNQAPAIKWNNEMKLYDAGDEKKSAREMLSLLKSQKEHANYLNWLKALSSKLESGRSVSEVGDNE